MISSSVTFTSCSYFKIYTRVFCDTSARRDRLVCHHKQKHTRMLPVLPRVANNADGYVKQRRCSESFVVYCAGHVNQLEISV